MGYSNIAYMSADFIGKKESSHIKMNYKNRRMKVSWAWLQIWTYWFICTLAE